jgi:hydrogenase maturation protease
MISVVVVGLGQNAAGDDAVGLWVARQLVKEGIPARESGDATLLLDLVAQGQHVIVVDAVVCAAVSGTVMQLTPDALASGAVSPVSCHGLGVAQVLELARLLYGDAASRIAIVAISIARPSGMSEQLSASASAAIPEACALVRRLLERTQAGLSNCDGSERHA